MKNLFDKKTPTNEDVKKFFKGLKDEVEQEPETVRRLKELNEKMKKLVCR